MPTPPGSVTRRQFVHTFGLAALAAASLPNSLIAAGSTPRFRNLVTGRKLRIACIGLGGKGYSDSMACAEEEIVALCDVDFNYGRRMFQQFPQAARYRDYRQMLAEMGDRIDAVTISTPDHTHFGAALMAIELGKHVYVQKPLTHTIAEARILKAAAGKAGVVTQMGNQGHANEGTRLTKEWIDAGVIGTVREVHIWTDRPIWPQGVPLPDPSGPAPDTLDWNLWLGVAPERPYSEPMAHFNWRGFWDYGCGAIGDMGCHNMDAAFWALDLRGDATISAVSEGCTEVTAPAWSIVTYEFPKRGDRAPVKLVWYDGQKKPPVLPELGPGETLVSNGSYFIGDKGIIYNTDTYNGSPRLVPEKRMAAFTNRPKKTIPRVPGSNPHIEWIKACKGEGPTPGSNIVDYSADLTEMVLLGNLAIRAGQTIEWDSAKMSCVNAPAANRFVNKSYRLF